MTEAIIIRVILSIFLPSTLEFFSLFIASFGLSAEIRRPCLSILRTFLARNTAIIENTSMTTVTTSEYTPMLPRFSITSSLAPILEPIVKTSRTIATV